MDLTFGVIGGDRRQTLLAELLRQDGAVVLDDKTEDQWQSSDNTLQMIAEKAKVILLPIPLCSAEGTVSCGGKTVGTEELFAAFRNDQLLLAGGVQIPQFAQAQERNLRLIDYLRCESLAVANAEATAEGAVRLLMEETEQTVCGKRCLVLGYGRIGKLLCRRLQGMGARVSAAARKSADRVWIGAGGCSALDLMQLREELGAFDAIFNTVPAKVLSAEQLALVGKNCLLTELASSPGFDPAEAEALGLRTVRGGGLPGRYFPQTAAEAIRDTVYRLIQEEGIV